jgi:hypothetical protein
MSALSFCCFELENCKIFANSHGTLTPCHCSVSSYYIHRTLTTFDEQKMSDNINEPATAPYIKHDSPEVKDVCYFADRFWYVLELKKKKLNDII